MFAVWCQISIARQIFVSTGDEKQSFVCMQESPDCRCQAPKYVSCKPLKQRTHGLREINILISQPTSLQPPEMIDLNLQRVIPSSASMLSVCWPTLGTASMRAFTPSSPVPGGSSAGTRPVGVSTSVQRFLARSRGWFQTPCISLTEALAIAPWSNFSMTSAAFNLENTASISFLSSSLLATRAEFVENR